MTGELYGFEDPDERGDPADEFAHPDATEWLATNEDYARRPQVPAGASRGDDGVVFEDDPVEASPHQDDNVRESAGGQEPPRNVDATGVADAQAAELRRQHDVVVQLGYFAASVDDGAESKTSDAPAIPESKLDPEVYRIMREEVVREAEALLRTKDLVHGEDGPGNDDYLRDALGQVDRTTAHYTSSAVPCSDAARIGTMRRTTIDLTSYAAKTGREDAAQFGFDQLTDGDKWLVWADAYDTSKLAPQIIGDWKHDLDTAHEAGTEDQDTVTQASRMLALTMEKLHEYSSVVEPDRLAALREQQGLPAEGNGASLSLAELETAREEHKQAALEHGARLNELLDEMRATRTPANEFMGRTWTAENLEDHAILAFARAGIWEGAVALQERHHERAAHYLGQTIRAASGQLGRTEYQLLRFGGDDGKFLRWLNTTQRGEAGDPPRVNRHAIQNYQLLEQLVPDRMLQAGFQSFSESSALRMALDTGDYESVRAAYNAHIEAYGHTQSIRAALDVSQHFYEVAAAGAAHEVYEDAFLRELEPVEAQVDELFDFGREDEVDNELEQELNRLFVESGKLKEPVTSLHAKGRLATMFLRVAPNDKRVESLMTDVRTQWDLLEQRHGGEQDLVQTYKSLKSAGIDLAPEWKRDGTDGYIGYRPSSALLFRRDPSGYKPFSEGGRTTERYNIESLKEIVDTAAALNATLGIDRYQVLADPEDMEQVAALRAHNANRAGPYDLYPLTYTKHAVDLTGPWRLLFSTEQLGHNREFYEAAGNLRSGWDMHRDTTKTDRLRQLLAQAEGEWQSELDQSN